MAKKKKPDDEVKHRPADPNVMGLHPEVLEQPITETLEINYMPYAMSVIVSRAIPEIDGFKPSHRKLLYTMYTMKLLGGARTKSANIVGQTMKLNPHGDAAIYETMVRLATGNEALLAPFVESVSYTHLPGIGGNKFTCWMPTFPILFDFSFAGYVLFGGEIGRAHV